MTRELALKEILGLIENGQRILALTKIEESGIETPSIDLFEILELEQIDKAEVIRLVRVALRVGYFTQR